MKAVSEGQVEAEGLSSLFQGLVTDEGRNIRARGIIYMVSLQNLAGRLSRRSKHSLKGRPGRELGNEG